MNLMSVGHLQVIICAISSSSFMDLAIISRVKPPSVSYSYDFT